MLNRTALRSVDLNLLVLFDVVMLERHVGRTARALHVSPSAVSHGLGRLRALFGDPLFLKTPKGVVPTARAQELAEPIRDLLGRAGHLLRGRETFDAATCNRGFRIGTLDAPATSFLPPLLTRVRRSAPGVTIEVTHVAIKDAFSELDAHRVDVTFLPIVDAVPARFSARTVYEEEFVVVARARHRYLREPTLENYCCAPHLLVSPAGGTRGFVDDALERRGLARKVVVVVPNFLLGMSVLAHSDLIGTMPRRVVALHGKRFGLRSKPAPLPLLAPGSMISAMVPKVALQDRGIAWLYATLCDSAA
jgi:DNA-binding transcriptional LysR family regulator